MCIGILARFTGIGPQVVQQIRVTVVDARINDAHEDVPASFSANIPPWLAKNVRLRPAAFLSVVFHAPQGAKHGLIGQGSDSEYGIFSDAGDLAMFI